MDRSRPPLMNNVKAGNRSLLLLWAVPVIFLGLFYFFPLGTILTTSISRSEGSWLQPWVKTITSPAIRSTIGFSFWQASLSTILTLFIGLPGAYLLARYNFPGKSVLKAVTAIPFVLPTLVVAASFNTLIGTKGWLNLGLMSLFNLSSPPIQLTHTLAAILIAHVFYNTTIVLRMVSSFWEQLDTRLVSAARSLGASVWQSFLQITLPLLLPVIASAALLVFIFDFSSFGVILVLGGPQFSTLETEIYYQTVSLFNLPVAAVLSLFQLICMLLLTAIYSQQSGKITLPVDQRPAVSTKRLPTDIGTKILLFFIITFLILFFVAPLLSLSVSSFVSLEPDRRQRTVDQGFTLTFYRELFSNPSKSLFYASSTSAIGTSITYALITVLISVTLGLPAAWALAYHQKAFLNQILDPLLMLPLGTSAVTLGLGFILAFDQPPLDLRSSPLLIPLAHSLVAFPFVVRNLVPALSSIKPRLRQAASILGASPSQVFISIDLPLVGRSLLVAAAFAFVISMGEFGATSLVYRPEYPTIPVVIYRYLSRPGGLNYGKALALSTILLVVTLLSIWLMDKLRITDKGEF
ncbi:MAG: iron ABC transporter permease [Anaerolineales bacterium]|nr:iron ABC transporter permease [Anaerolineales bacterium]